MLQVIREPPTVPQRVIYTSLQDLRKDICQLPVTWVVLVDQEDNVAVGVVNESSVKLREGEHQNLNVAVLVLGVYGGRV